MAATIAGTTSLRVLTDFDLEMVAVGAGGPGQDWNSSGFTVSGVSYAGGSGGGSGGVSKRTMRLVRGDTIDVTIGLTGSYDNSFTYIRVNRRYVLAAPGGQPYVSATTYQSRTDSVEGDRDRVTGSSAGTASERPNLTSPGSVPARFLGEFAVRGNSFQSPAVVHPVRRASLLGISYFAGSGARGLAYKVDSTRDTQNVWPQFYHWMAGGGGGAGGSAPRPTSTAADQNRLRGAFY